MNFSLKKILLTTFILLEVSALFAFSAFPKSIENTEVKTSNLMRPKVTISFEIARRRDCMGFGFCNISIGISTLRVNSCTATLYTDEVSRNTLILEVDKLKGVTSTAYDKYFKSGIFVVEDDSPVPTEVLKELGISGSKSIAAGNYKVTEKDGKLIIAIPVK